MRLICKLAVTGFFLIMLFALPALSDDSKQIPASEGPTALPALAAGDTVRTNVWLTQALMAEVITEAAKVLPPPPAAIRLEDRKISEESGLFQVVASDILGSRGYELYLSGDDDAHEGAVEFVFGHKVQVVKLDYPEVGRTLGIWNQWVSRELQINATIEITEADSGRLLFSERMERRFADKIPYDDFDAVNSGIYSFTNSEIEESGWRGRVEEIVVLGTLVGLITVYFANTNN